jgi:prepilin peptidase CpaA
MIHVLQSAVLFAFPVLVIAGAVTDAASYRIPNWISLALAAAFPVAALAAGAPLALMGANLGAGVAALAVGMIFFSRGWIGGGDAKLFAAAALWLGWPAAPVYLVATCLAGGALALFLLMLRSVWVRPLVMGGPAWVARLAEPGEGVPYGVAVAVGALAAFPAAPLARGLGAPL